MKLRSALFAILLCICSLPTFAANCENPIAALTPSDSQTGTPVQISWSLGGVVPLSQTLTGHDFEQPAVIAPNQLGYSYVPSKPGEKHVTLTVVTECGTFSRTSKYHVKQCNVVTPTLSIDKSSVTPGETITASIDLLPGHTARWVVLNGTASATSGASIQIVAGTSGNVVIDVFVARGKSCEVSARASVAIVEPCSIAEPEMIHPPIAPASDFFTIFLPSLPAGQTATFAATGATIVFSDGQFVAMETPATGSFTVDITLSNGTCSRTFSRTFEVTACEPKAVVSSVSDGSCGGGTLRADFTGTAPFQGYWSDGQFFFTSESHIERSVTASGTYTITFFFDAYCQGTSSGSATVGASFPTPTFALDELVDGGYYGTDTCPGLARTARLTTPVPAGLEVVWTVENGTILSGQGTDVLQFAGTNPGATSVSVVFRNAECTSPAAVNPHILTLGTPEVSVSVEPSTIGAGGTAIVTVTRLNNYVRGFDVFSSNGDPLVPVGPVGETGFQYEYRSVSGGGVSTITATAMNACGVPGQATTTLTIDGGTPVGAHATVRALGTSCQDYAIYAEFSGVAPFSGTWSGGETFVTNEPYWYLYPPNGGTYTLTQFSDANGAGTISGSATFDFIALPAPQITVDPANGCANGTATATIGSTIPDGATVTWMVYGGTILSGQGTNSIQIQLGEFGASLNAQISGGGYCSPFGGAFIPVNTFVQQPQFDLYGAYAGSSFEFFVMLDPNTASWGFENTMGDAMEIVSSPFPNAYIVRYTSSHGAGESHVRIYRTTHCGTQFEATRTLVIFPPPPTITLTSTPGATCGATVTATLTGTGPFTVTWTDNGESVTTSETTVTHFVPFSGYVYAYVTDAYGTTSWSEPLYVESAQLPYPGVSSEGRVCVGATTTVTASNVPDGAEVFWSLEGANGRIVSGQGTNELVVEGVEAGTFFVSMSYRTAEGCVSGGTGTMIEVPAPAAAPVITLPSSTITAGETIDITVTFDGNYQTLNWENSMGDALFNVDQQGMTFTLRYISQNGPGTSTIRAYGTTLCGQEVEATATLTINP